MCMCEWQPIETVPENKRVYAFGWHMDSDGKPTYEEEAMVWKDRIDGLFYYAPQGGIIDWKPTHWMRLHKAPSETAGPPE